MILSNKRQTKRQLASQLAIEAAKRKAQNEKIDETALQKFTLKNRKEEK